MSPRIDQGWIDALGLSGEEIAGLSLREFVERCSDLGIVPEVQIIDPPVAPGLHLKAEDTPLSSLALDGRDGSQRDPADTGDKGNASLFPPSTT